MRLCVFVRTGLIYLSSSCVSLQLLCGTRSLCSRKGETYEKPLVLWYSSVCVFVH